jgi:hypothetical protein
MAKQLTEQELRQLAVEALSEAFRSGRCPAFLALISCEPFDYQQWRREYFSRYTVDELLGEARKPHSGKVP